MSIKVSSAIIMVGFLIGCTTGAKEFTCGEFPESSCQPVSEAYESTNGELDEYDYRGQLFQDEPADTPHSKAHAMQTTLPVIQIGNTTRAMNYAVAGDPIFSQPKILRVLVTEWIDDNNHFHGGSFVYLVVEDGKWLLKN